MWVFGNTSDNKIVLRSNVAADVLRSFGQDLQDVAEELMAPTSRETRCTSRSAPDRAPAYPAYQA